MKHCALCAHEKQGSYADIVALRFRPARWPSTLYAYRAANPRNLTAAGRCPHHAAATQELWLLCVVALQQWGEDRRWEALASPEASSAHCSSRQHHSWAKAPMRKLMPREVYAYFRRYVMVRHMPKYVYMFMSNMYDKSCRRVPRQPRSPRGSGRRARW